MRATLRILTGPLKGQTFTFDRHETLVVGRDDGCGIRIEGDKRVSGRHCLLEVAPPAVGVRDLGSVNGIVVNGARHGGNRSAMPEPLALRHGDVLRLGGTALRLEVESAPATVQVRCERCGAEAAGLEDAAWLCPSCVRTVVADPVDEVVQRILDRARMRAGAGPRAIPGYAVRRLLGHGGMGAVYVAERETDGAEVALKVMLARVAVSETARREFLREADVMRGLRHPNIVELHESGSAGCGFYFVMEYCEGGSVAQLLQEHRGGIPLALAAPMMLGALDGLAHAHERGFVHRDLKPDNVLLAGSTAKISDFGFAKSFHDAGFSGMTATGDYAGTCHFMPREQIANFKYVGPATDVWAMAATFYMMLTGQLPRDFAASADPVMVVLESPVIPLRERNPQVPEKLAAVLERALAERAQERFPTAGEFRAALGEVVC